MSSDKDVYHHDLDAARGVLMVLGVLLHSASVYMVHFTWAVNDPARHVAFNYINSVIHLFRMPAFFLVAGFFCAWSFSRYPVGEVVRRRLLRLGLPFLSTALLVGSAQWWLIWQANAAGVSRRRQTDAWLDWLIEGGLVGHLWFLLILLAFVLVAAIAVSFPAVARIARGLGEGAGDRIPRWLLTSGFLVFAFPLLSFIAPGFARLFPGVELGYGSASLKLWLTYLPFFVVGLWMWASPQLREALLACHYWYAPVGAVAFVWLIAKPASASSLSDTVIVHYVYSLAVWSTSLLFLALFHRWCRRRIGFFTWLAGSSYTIYLFHHLLVVAGGFALTTVDWSPAVKYPVLVLGVVLVASVIHEGAITRSRWLSLAFNGQMPRGSRPARPTHDGR